MSRIKKSKAALRLTAIVQKHKLALILLAALFTVAALTFLGSFPASRDTVTTIAEENGVYDLRHISDFESGLILLAPPETYYPNTYLSPEGANGAIPESIKLYGPKRCDYLSQRFCLLLPDGGVYTLSFTLSGRHAMRVYVNGRLAGQSGTPGTTKNDTELWENNITVSASSPDGKMDVILHSAQFYHSSSGASLAGLSISPAGAGTSPFTSGQLKGLIVMGALLCAAALLLGVYLMISRTGATLYFALACLSMALRECLQSQAWVYFPINGNLSFMLEYLSMPLLTIFLSLYLNGYVKGKFLKTMQLSALIGSFIYGLCVLLCDSLFYTGLLKYYQLLLVSSIVLGISGLLFRLRRPNTEQSAAIYGITVFYLAAVYDIVMYSDIFGDSTNIPISEIAMLVFVLAQVISVFLMNNRVLVEIKEAEQRMETEKAALESLNRLKTEFLGNVSHELKTPLTVISGYAQTTKQLAETKQFPESLEVSRRMSLISSEAERLSLMVGQILDLTRMEEGRMLMEPVRCYAEEIIHSAVETHYPILNKNRNRLAIRIESGLPPVYADPGRISQVIVNLISNAVRFTSDGLITVSAEKTDGGLSICVSDTGIGIEAQRLPHIFDRYGKKQKSGGGQDTGTGLGLYICKYIVEQHGGQIRIESTEGQGTSVFFTLPAVNSEPC